MRARPLPWHDTARCEEKDCGGPMIPDGFRTSEGTRIKCVACGHGRIGSREDVEKTLRAHRAWELYEDGNIHLDRGCARCGWVLPVSQERLCPPCVKKDNAERQASLFPGASR